MRFGVPHAVRIFLLLTGELLGGVGVIVFRMLYFADNPCRFPLLEIFRKCKGAVLTHVWQMTVAGLAVLAPIQFLVNADSWIVLVQALAFGAFGPATWAATLEGIVGRMEWAEKVPRLRRASCRWSGADARP